MIETYPSQSCDIKQKVEIIYNMNGALILIQKVKRGKKNNERTNQVLF